MVGQKTFCAEKYDKNNNFCLTGWCAEGYKGNLCADCADGYALEDKVSNTCVTCENNPTYYLRALGMFIISVSIVSLTIHNSIKEIDKKMKKEEGCRSRDGNQYDSDEEKDNNEIMSTKKREMEEASQGKNIFQKQGAEEDSNEDYSPIYLKILFNYLQILSVFGTLNFDWPITLREFFHVSEITVTSPKNFFSFDCRLKQSSFKERNFRLFYTQLLLYAVSPFLFCIPTIIFWIIYFFIKFKSKIEEQRQRLYNYLMTSLVIILYIIHPNIVDTSFLAFS